MGRVIDLIDPAYRLENYRQLYEDPSRVLVLPVLDMIAEDTLSTPAPPSRGSVRSPQEGASPIPKDPVKGGKGCLCLEQCADVRTPWRGAGRRRAVAGNGRAVAGGADSAHEHRLIQQEAVAIFGLVVL